MIRSLKKHKNVNKKLTFNKYTVNVFYGVNIWILSLK